MAVSTDTTHLLLASQRGDREAAEQLLELLYRELHTLAAGLLRRERPGHTLQPTALVHETYLRLVKQDKVGWKDRAHFFSASARIIRQILVDHARRRGAAKRGGSWERVTIDAEDPTRNGGIDLLALDEALEKLEELNPRQRQIVELRYFGGLTIEETGASLDVCAATVKAEWAMARAWLKDRLAR